MPYCWDRGCKQCKANSDIGTGSGEDCTLMLAQKRTDDKAHIDAIEIEKEDCSQAKENVLRSLWPSKVSVFEKSFKKFEPTIKYDLTS